MEPEEADDWDGEFASQVSATDGDVRNSFIGRKSVRTSASRASHMDVESTEAEEIESQPERASTFKNSAPRFSGFGMTHTPSAAEQFMARQNSILFWEQFNHKRNNKRKTVVGDLFVDMFNPQVEPTQFAPLDLSYEDDQRQLDIPAREIMVRRPNVLKTIKLRLIGTMERKPCQRLQLIIENYGEVTDNYNLDGNQLGRGSFGHVTKAHMKTTAAVRAIKHLDKEQIKERFAFLKKEIEITKMTDHPGIVKLYEIFEDDSFIYLVMECCHGGTLQSRLKLIGCLKEGSADCPKHVMLQIFKALNYLHKIGICHRDLKPDKFLLAHDRSGRLNSSKPISIRMSDFGLSCTFLPGQLLTGVFGTLAYMAPEVLDKKYRQTVDVWSCGVIMYQVLCGSLPFTAANKDELKKIVKAGNVKFAAAAWVDVSTEAAQMALQCLQKDSAKRLTIQRALAHPWLSSGKPLSDLKLDASLVRNLRMFRSLNKFKRAVFHVIASMLREEQIAYPREVFMALDKDGDGFVDVSELWLEMKKFYPEVFAEVTHIFQDGDWGVVDYCYTEFIAATFDRAHCDRNVVWAAFNVFDHDGGGTISLEELQNGNVLGILQDDDLALLVADFDQNGDGELDFDEFRQMLNIDDFDNFLKQVSHLSAGLP